MARGFVATVLTAIMGLAGCGGPSLMQKCLRGGEADCTQIQRALEASFCTGPGDRERVNLLAGRVVEGLRAGAPGLAPEMAACRSGVRAACDRVTWAASATMMTGIDAGVLQRRLGRAMALAMSGGIEFPGR